MTGTGSRLWPPVSQSGRAQTLPAKLSRYHFKTPDALLGGRVCAKQTSHSAPEGIDDKQRRGCWRSARDRDLLAHGINLEQGVGKRSRVSRYLGAGFIGRKLS